MNHRMATKPDDDVDELSKKVQELDMAGPSAATDNDGLSSCLTTESNGSHHQLEEVENKGHQAGNQVHQFKVQSPDGMIRSVESKKTLQIQGNQENKKKIKPVIKKRNPVPDNKRKAKEDGESSSTRNIQDTTMAGNNCQGQCHSIYSEGDGHIKQRKNPDEKILGSKDKFCAAFYHVPKSTDGSIQHSCLDEDNCVIGKETSAKEWYGKRKATVAVVKFQKVDGSILYEARYTNCSKKQAEDFFGEDIKSGKFKEIVNSKSNETATLYLTLHPCNKSTEGEQESAEESQSSCAILKRIVTETLRENGPQIKLLVKATNLDLLRKEDGTLHERAAREIKDLMRIEGVNVSEMTDKDWDYLFLMTEEFSIRLDLDGEVQSVFDQIRRITLPAKPQNSKSLKITSRTESEAGCEGERCPIYGENPHIKRREHKNEPILGSSAQFCAAFYHVHEWNPRKHYCLDEKRCIIARRVQEEDRDWNLQPIQVIAVAKFEDKDGNILYEAKYSNCKVKNADNHAENFFRRDIEDSNGVLKQLVQNNPNGTITLYITYQPCHMSINTNTTHPNQSCCNILEGIVTQILRADGRKIDLCVKATHAHSSLRLTGEQGKREELRQNAVKGIKNLMRIEGVSVSRMTPEDWAYLFSLTEYFSRRQVLDNDVKQILNEINSS